MSYTMKVKQSEVFGHNKYVNHQGLTECVEFVRQVSSAPVTSLWKPGIQVKAALIGKIPPGTAIATFDDQGKYPMDTRGKHAAIYLGQSAVGIQVLDQWNAQGEVLPRTIRFNHPGKRSNNGDTYYVIE